MNDKGQVSTNVAIGVIMFIAVATLIAVMVSQVNQDIRSDTAAMITNTVVNETLTSVDEHGEIIGNVDQCGFSDFTILVITNATSGTRIAGNYTYTAAGLVQSTGVGIYNNTNWNVTYTFLQGEIGCNSSLETDKGIFKISGNLDLVGLAVAFGLVITIIFAAIKIKQDSF
jgi:hypothetical protein